jgi:hypothetical protein
MGRALSGPWTKKRPNPSRITGIASEIVEALYVSQQLTCQYQHAYSEKNQVYQRETVEALAVSLLTFCVSQQLMC